ncbi:MAG: hypothetical protein IAE66_06265 [Xanthomonadaceae bacterium]|nr:hypothetical protein [Xanthomonadaceae bacterium]
MSPADQHLAAQAALYGPSAVALARTMAELGEGLSAQLADLERDPTPVRAELMAINLEGAKRAVLRLREALVREGTE